MVRKRRSQSTSSQSATMAIMAPSESMTNEIPKEINIAYNGLNKSKFKLVPGHLQVSNHMKDVEPSDYYFNHGLPSRFDERRSKSHLALKSNLKNKFKKYPKDYGTLTRACQNNNINDNHRNRNMLISAINKAKRSEINKRKQQKIENSIYYANTKCQAMIKYGYCNNPKCSFRHDFKVKKVEQICKYYTTDSCNRGDTCIFMHNEYPCKYFHIRKFCYNENNCKFSHEPLDDVGKRIIDELKADINEKKALKLRQNEVDISYGQMDSLVPNQIISMSQNSEPSALNNKMSNDYSVFNQPLEMMPGPPTYNNANHHSYFGIDLSSSFNPYQNKIDDELMKSQITLSNDSTNKNNFEEDEYNPLNLVKLRKMHNFSLPEHYHGLMDPRIKKYTLS